MEKKPMFRLKTLIVGQMLDGLAISSVGVIAQTAPPAGAAAVPTPAPSPLPASECIQTDQINEWHVVDAQTAIVRTGPKRYLVKLGSSCPNLGLGGGGLMFHAAGQDRDVGSSRICGGVGETAYARNQPPCPIQSVSKIPKDQFQQLRDAAKKYSGS